MCQSTASHIYIKWNLYFQCMRTSHLLLHTQSLFLKCLKLKAQQCSTFKYINIQGKSWQSRILSITLNSCLSAVKVTSIFCLLMTTYCLLRTTCLTRAMEKRNYSKSKWYQFFPNYSFFRQQLIDPFLPPPRSTHRHQTHSCSSGFYDVVWWLNCNQFLYVISSRK